MKKEDLIAGTIEDEFRKTCPSRLVTQIIRICSERALEMVEIDKEVVRKAIVEGSLMHSDGTFGCVDVECQHLIWDAADNITKAKGIIKIKEEK